MFRVLLCCFVLLQYCLYLLMNDRKARLMILKTKTFTETADLLLDQQLVQRDYSVIANL